MFVGTLYEKYLNHAKTLTREEFCVGHKGFYLLGMVASHTPAGEMDFVTGIIHLDEIDKNPTSRTRAGRLPAEPGNFLSKLEKKPGVTWPEWISIGRANNNDIVIKHPSVSKLHARLDIKKPSKDRSDEGAGFWIMDLNSSKGTTVNGKPLDNNMRYPVQQVDSIKIGEVDVVILDAGKLYDSLLSNQL